MKKIQIYLFILFIIGIIMLGYNNTTYKNVNISKKYNFKLLPRMHEQRSKGASLVSLKDGRVLITGGMSDDKNSTNSAEIYDPKANKFFRAANMNFSRTMHSSFLLNDGNILVTGGITCLSNKICESLKSAEIYDTKNNKFLLINDMDFSMGYPKIMRAKDGSIIVFEKDSEIDIFDEKKYQFSPYIYNKESNNNNTIDNVIISQ